ncbi:MAG: ATP-binding protein [Candidatus Diapherotrites archaeon]|nr:ATP-binding protein [Candidatus Diapherotrites archaeon]
MVINDSVLTDILAVNETSRKQAQKYPKRRFIFNELFFYSKAFVGIAGLRGIGKTTALKQRLIESENAFYISLDAYNNIDLFDLAKTLSERFGANELLLDEISYCKNWQQHLKKIYDSMELKVFFTSSVAIDIINSRVDLSRRIIVKKMHPFSFREYLAFGQKKDIPKMTINDIFDPKKMQKISRLDNYFEEYISGGLIPVFLEEKNTGIFLSILERIIEKDLVYSLNFDGKDLINIRAMLEYIANAGIDDVSYSSIARNVGITKYKAIHYVQALEKAFVLNPIKPKGSNVSKEPKILFVPPLRLVYSKNKEIKENIGFLREEFFVESMKINDFETHYLKGQRGEKKPDYFTIINGQKFVFEIGGKQKNRTQIIHSKEKNKFILTQPANTINPYRPLIFAGFL